MDPLTVELRLTLATNPPRDLAVRAPAGTTLGQLSDRLDDAPTAELDGGAHRRSLSGGARQWSVEGVTLDRRHPLGRPPLLDGARLQPASAPAPAGTSASGAWPPSPQRSPHAGGSTTPLVEVHVVAGPQVGQRLPVRSPRVSVGRDPANDLVIDDVDVSRRHLELVVPRGGDRSPSVRDLASSNGSRVLTPGTGSGTQTDPAATLEPGDIVALGSHRIALRPAGRAAHLLPDDLGHLLVHRSPRTPEPVVEQVVTVPAEPAPRAVTRPSWPMVALPLLFAVPAAWWWHQPMLLLMGLLSPLTVLAQFGSDRRRARRERRRAAAEHLTARAAADDEVRQALRRAAAHAWDRYPDPADVAATAATRDVRLWQRGPGDDDLLTLRLGTGEQPGPVRLLTPEGEQRPPVLDAPVTVDLAEVAVLGVYGPPPAVRAVARSLVGQAAVRCSPTDLAITVLTGAGPRQDEWAWTAWLPHASGALPAPEDEPDGLPARQAPTSRTGPRHLVVLDGPLQQQGVAQLLRRPGAAVLICLADTRAQLPRQCRAVLSIGATRTDEPDGRLERCDAAAVTCRLELPGAGWAHTLARDLAPLRDAAATTPDRGLPPQVRLLDLVPDGGDPAAVARRWLSAPPGRLAAPLGATETGTWQVDLVRDGPHVLVAGTTGAGKSELLTTMVASLALHHSPQSLGLLLVDYKGGTAFGRLVELPHVTGVVTDLDGAHSHRVLSSLTAELRRREAALATARDAAEAAERLLTLGRLVIVVDEFRVLAEEQPQVLTGLVRVATVGRGLGVHLVLATQRPAGVVSGEMRSNVALRIGLRVRDRSDSDDVLDAPHAARLGAELPGRAWVRDASGRLFAVQTAHVPSGPSAPPPPAEVRSDRPHDPRAGTTDGCDDLCWAPLLAEPGVPSRQVASLPPRASATELDDLGAVVSAVRAAAGLLGLQPARPAWLPPLPHLIAWSELSAHAEHPPTGPDRSDSGSVALPFALADLPDRQQQRPMTWQLPRDGHLAVSGGPGSGRTTLAHTLAFAAAAAGLEVHVIDGSAALTGALAGQVSGTVVPGPDVERTVRLVRALARRLTAADTDGDRASAAPTVLVVDGWEGLEQTWSRAGWVQGPDELQALARDGTAAGLRLVVTGGRALLSGAMAAVLPERLLLRTADPTTALLAGVAAAHLPSPWPDGRVLRIRGSEVTAAQVAVAPAGPATVVPDVGVDSGSEAVSSLGRLRLAPLPRSVRYARLPRGRRDARLLVGLGGDGAEPLALHPSPGCLVTGPAASGRSTALATLAHALVDTGHRVVVVTETPQSPYWPRGPGVTLVARRGSRLLGLSAALDRSNPLTPGPPAACLQSGDLTLLLDDGWPVAPGLDDLALAHLTDPGDGGEGDEDDGGGATGGAGLRVVAAVCSSELVVAFRGLVPTLRDGGAVIALGARSWAGDPLSPGPPVPGSPPGRGLMGRAGRWQPVQVALPPSGASGPTARLAAVRQPARGRA